MATSDDRYLRRVFVALLIASAATIAVLTLYPVKAELVIIWVSENIILTREFMTMVYLLILSAAILIPVGGSLIVYSKLKARYRRFLGRDLRQYDDPSRLE